MKKIGVIFFKYFAGIVAVLCAVLVGQLLNPILHNHYLFLLFIAVVLSALYGGLGVGLLATVLATIAQNYFFQIPHYTFAVQNLNDWTELGLFLVIATFMSCVGASMRSARKTAEDASRAREEMMAIVSHDLKNPLTAIQLNAELILRMSADDPKEMAMQKKAGQIRKSTDRMYKLIHNILDYDKLQNGTLSFDHNKESVSALVNEIAMVIDPLAKEKAINFTINEMKEDFRILCDKERILQVLSNLLGNAVKFTPPGGKIILDVHRLKNSAVFVIKDNGPGIPRENLPHIFDRYWQAKDTAKQGSGLGLSIAKGIIEGHRGTIKVESEVGVGTTFTFTLSLPFPYKSSKYFQPQLDEPTTD